MTDYIQKQEIRVQCDSAGLSSLVKTVSDLICEITGLQILEKITYGSEEFEGYPIYNQRPPKKISTTDFASWFITGAHQSDIYILGMDEDNYCLTVNVYNGNLLIGMGCSKAYGDRYNAKLNELFSSDSKVNPHNPLTLATRNTYKVCSFNNMFYNTHIPLKKNTDGIVTLTLGHYKGSNSQGVKFSVNLVESPWILFTTSDDGAKFAMLGFRGYNYDIESSNFAKTSSSVGGQEGLRCSFLVIPFSKTIPLYDDMIATSKGQWKIKNIDNILTDNTPFIPDVWCDAYFTYYGNGSTANATYDCAHVAQSNTINLYQFNYPGVPSGYFSFLEYIKYDTGAYYITPLNQAFCFNLPKLAPNQVYLRRLYAPNSYKKFNLYLWYSPVLDIPPANAFYKIGEDVYLHVVNKMIGYAIKV